MYFLCPSAEITHYSMEPWTSQDLEVSCSHWYWGFDLSLLVTGVGEYLSVCLSIHTFTSVILYLY